MNRSIWTKTVALGGSVGSIGGDFLIQGTTAYTATWYFTLNDANASAYSGIYDQYKIRKVKISLVPASGNFTTELQESKTVDSYGFGTLCVVPNMDGGAITTEIAAIGRYGAKRTNTCSGKGLSCIIKPNVLEYAYNGGSANAIPKGRQWIDVVYPDVRHYGISIYMGPKSSVDAPAAHYKIFVTFYLAFKHRIGL